MKKSGYRIVLVLLYLPALFISISGCGEDTFYFSRFNKSWLSEFKNGQLKIGF
jgi:hypothetical protein